MPVIRIVAMADTHTEHDKLTVPDGDILIHAGDMCGYGEYDELETTAEWFTSLPHRHKLVIAGNHDWPFVTRPKKVRALFSRYLQDEETTIEGIRFYGSPWQPWFYDWAFNLPRGRQLASVWSKIPMHTDILITHGPPHGYGDLCFDGDRVGCEDLLRRVSIVKPKLHLFGHIHNDGGAWKTADTCFVNVTTWDSQRSPTVVDYEPHTGEVTLVNVPPKRNR